MHFPSETFFFTFSSLKIAFKYYKYPWKGEVPFNLFHSGDKRLLSDFMRK